MCSGKQATNIYIYHIYYDMSGHACVELLYSMKLKEN